MKFAVVDLDETLIDGVLASKIARALLDPRRTSGIVPRKYYLKLLKYIHIPFLSKLRRIRRVYKYIIRKGYELYLKIMEDKDIDREKLLSLMYEVVEGVPLAKEGKELLEILKKKGYTVVLVTATPQEIANYFAKLHGIDMAYGSRPELILDLEGKELVVKEISKKGRVEIIVGNPGNEPFHLAERLAVIVRSPKDLRRWLPLI